MDGHSKEYDRNRELMSTHLRRRHTPDLSPTMARLPLGVSLRPKCIELQKHRDLALHVPSGKTIRAAEYEWACGRLSAITITASGLGVAVKPFILTAVVVFVLIALVHLVRLFTGWEVVVNGFVVPVWWSAPILVIFGGLAFLVWREAHH